MLQIPRAVAKVEVFTEIANDSDAKFLLSLTCACRILSIEGIESLLQIISSFGLSFSYTPAVFKT